MKKIEKWYLVVVLFIAIALGLFILSAYLSGWDLFTYLVSPRMIAIYCLVFAGLIAILVYLWLRSKNE